MLGVSAEPSRFIVAGGMRFIGGLVDIEDRLTVEIYNPRSRSWELGPPLPDDFRSGNSSQSLSSALFGDGNKYNGSIYMVFEYMDHDLTSLSDRPGQRFTIPQIKVS